MVLKNKRKERKGKGDDLEQKPFLCRCVTDKDSYI
jgi:hypothetical protein